jgi:hypothetical protein
VNLIALWSTRKLTDVIEKQRLAEGTLLCSVRFPQLSIMLMGPAARGDLL